MTELTNRTSGATEAEVRKINYLDQERTKTKEKGIIEKNKQINPVLIDDGTKR